MKRRTYHPTEIDMEGQAILRKDMKHLRSETEDVVDELKTILEDTADLAGEQMSAVREAAEERVRKALARLEDVEERLEWRFQRALKQSERLVSGHPWEAAAGAALVAGAITAAVWLVLRRP